MSNFIPRLKLLRVVTVALSITLLAGWFLSRNSIDNTHAQSSSFKNFEGPQIHPLAKHSKDLAAGMVLIASLASVAVGLLILGPPLWKRIFG